MTKRLKIDFREKTKTNWFLEKDKKTEARIAFLKKKIGSIDTWKRAEPSKEKNSGFIFSRMLCAITNALILTFGLRKYLEVMVCS